MRYLHTVILAFLPLSLVTLAYTVERVPPAFDQQKLAEDIGGLKVGQQSLQQQVNDLKSAIEKRIDETRSSLKGNIDETKSSLKGSIDETKSSLKGSIDETNTWLRAMLAAIIGIFVAIAGGAIALWKQLGVIEGKVAGIQPNVELLWKLRPDMERLVGIRPELEQISDGFEEFKGDIGVLRERQSNMTSDIFTMNTSIERLISDQRETLQAVKNLSDRLNTQGR
jgi:chromosome segregation ATPase